jgi:radical SAM superfamily enzyme YgiQ (UPF0313 family)
MAKYVLVSDPTLSWEYSWRSYRLPSVPANYVPSRIYQMLAGPRLPHDNGRAQFAPYGLRKVEAALLGQCRSDEVVVAHPDYAHLFIDGETKIVGVYTMDPIGLGAEVMMFTNGRTQPSIQESEFTKFMLKLHNARMKRNPRTKLVVGGAGSWELNYTPYLTKQLHIDHVVQGEIEDVAFDLFDQLAAGTLDDRFTFGYQTYDEDFRKIWSLDDDHVFVTRSYLRKQFPNLDEIPTIRGATVNGLTEVMRGCGIGCDFCEVTLRPSRYYDPDFVKREIEVNLRAGVNNSWFHSDEVFAYEHGRNFEPNQEALIRLFTAIMETGVEHANPTHGRISIPAAYPDLISTLSTILRAGPGNWIAVQIGLETGSDELIKKHMPIKTLPLHVGPDGSWAEIVTEGVMNLNENYWRPAFTVQIGQEGETAEDNWMTVGLINDLSRAEFEFTITPVVNVPLGLLKTRGKFYPILDSLDEAQASVIYACFRHMQKEAFKHTASTTKLPPLVRAAMAQVVMGGFAGVTGMVEWMFRRKGFSMEKAKKHSLGEKQVESLTVPANL